MTLSDREISKALGEPNLSPEAARIVRTIVQAFADILIENERDHLDEDGHCA